MEKMKVTYNIPIEETEAYQKGVYAGLKKAQWEISKAMLALNLTISPEIRKLLKFIHDEIEKEIK